MADFIFRMQQATRAPSIDGGIPRVALQQKHIDHCELVLNRTALLQQLPQGGVCAEVGVDQGDFTAQILEVAQPKRLHLVDMWGTRRYSRRKYESVQSKFADEITNGDVVIHRTSSLQAATVFDAEYFDWIYLDTTHAYALTARELAAYAPKIKPGGYIAGHDYAMGNWSKVLRYGVIEAVHEFCVTAGWGISILTVDPIENQSFALQRLR